MDIAEQLANAEASLDTARTQMESARYALSRDWREENFVTQLMREGEFKRMNAFVGNALPQTEEYHTYARCLRTRDALRVVWARAQKPLPLRIQEPEDVSYGVFEESDYV